MLQTTEKALRGLTCALAAFAIFLPYRAASGQSHWDRYEPGTIDATVSSNDSTIRRITLEKKPSYYFSGREYPTRARVVYKGDSRSINATRKELIRRWAAAFGRDTTIAHDFSREYLFQEGEKLLWLPVQDTVASYFKRELTPGQSVILYTMFVGAYWAGEEITWAFIVNEFEAVKPESIQ
jgi:hypothetical protein